MYADIYNVYILIFVFMYCQASWVYEIISFITIVLYITLQMVHKYNDIGGM